MNLFFVFMTGTIFAALAFGCGGAPAAQPLPSPDGPTLTSVARDESATRSEPAARAPEQFEPRVVKQIRVTRYEVAEGSVDRVSAGTEIIAEEGIEIAGTIRVDGAVDGDFVLTAETGDIVISGSIIVDGAKAATRLDGIRFASSDPFEALAPSDWLNQTRATPRPGVSYIVFAKQGDIVIARLTRFEAGDGQSALDEKIASWGGDFYAGTNGARGGDIVLDAPNGVIRLPTDREGGDPAIFDLGDGGDGANVEVDRQAFTTDEDRLLLAGGNGGQSGRLIFVTPSVEGVPSGRELFDNNMRLIIGGVGGKGGYAVWVAGKVGTVRFDEDGWAVEARQVFPKLEVALESIEMHGGHGGDGARVGGNGGVGGYLGANLDVGEPVPAVETSGGQGGAVFTSPVPVVAARGGDGGGFYAWGNNGWDGDKAEDGRTFRNGANGGSVFAWGGNGGHIVGDANQFPGGVGGNGGGSGTVGPNGEPWTLPQSGQGGRGMPGCENGGPGGEGGDTGALRVLGGDGGRGPLDGTSGEAGGHGGDVATLFPFAGDGADGNPPGAGGENGPVEVRGGTGGAGATPGSNGTWTGPDLEPNPPGDPGKPCEGEPAAQPPDAPPFDFSCRAQTWRKSGTINVDAYDALARCMWQLYDKVLGKHPTLGHPLYYLTKNEDRAKEYIEYLELHPEITPGE